MRTSSVPCLLEVTLPSATHANGPVTRDDEEILFTAYAQSNRENRQLLQDPSQKGKVRAGLGVGQALPALHVTSTSKTGTGTFLELIRTLSLPFLSTSCWSVSFSLSFLFVCAGTGLVARGGGRCARLEGSEGGKVTCLSFPGEGEMFLFWVRRCTMRDRTTASFFLRR